MAKGNLFLGTGRGSVGDTTFYRRNGQQVSRVRVRKVGNPKTSGQIIQRAVAATVLQMYSRGKAIFDHSFEGKSVPSGSQRAFMSANMRRLRAAYFDDVTNQYDADESLGHFVSPKATCPTINEYVISQGSFRPAKMAVALTSGGDPTHAYYLPVITIGASTTAGDVLDALGMRRGDIETLCVLAVGMPYGDDLDINYAPSAAEFAYLQFKVKDNLDLTAAITNASTVGDIFDVYDSGNRPSTVTSIKSKLLSALCSGDKDTAGTAGFNCELLYDNTMLAVGATGVIASREDSGERSVTVMRMWQQARCGITHVNLIDIWRNASVADSELVLEGSNF